MNTHTKLYIGLAVAILVLIVIFFYAYKSTPSEMSPVGTLPSETATTTDTVAPVTSPVEGVLVPKAKQASAPLVTTAAFATNISTSTAIIAGTLVPNGGPTDYWFEFGTTQNFTLRTVKQPAGDGEDVVAKAAFLQELKPQTQYYFRMGAQNSAGTKYGGVYSFITTSK